MRRAAVFAASFFIHLSGSVYGQSKPRVVHVFVALADNVHQGIIPVAPAMGNGDDPARNLYWGAAFGVRTYFRKSAEWKETLHVENPYKAILERSVFHHQTQNAVIVADAYRGSEIKQALTDFFAAAAGIAIHQGEPAACSVGEIVECPPEGSDVVAYVGHDGLMDFPLSMDFAARSNPSRPAIILACASRSFFKDLLKQSGATPLLWTNGLMAPEAYTLKAAVDAWLEEKPKEQVRREAAAAYAKYQKISDMAALRLFSSDW